MRPRWLLVLALLTGCAATPVVDAGGAGSGPPDHPEPHDEPGWLPPGPLSLELLLGAAEVADPGLSAARARWRAAGGRVVEAGLWPNPSVEIEKEEISTGGSGIRKSETLLGLRQPIVIGDRLDAAVAAARAGEDSLRQAFHAKRLAVRAEVRRLFVTILALRAEVALREELVEVAGGTVEIARIRYENRAAPESDLIRARNDVEELKLEALRLRERADLAAGELSAILGGVPLAPDRLAGTLPEDPPPAPDLEAVLARDHPAVKAALLSAEAQDRWAKALAAENVPDLGVRIAGGHSGAARAGVVEIGLEVELPVFSRHQGAIREAKALARARRAEAEEAGRDLVSRLRAARRSHEAATARHRRYEDVLLPAAERGLSQAREGYRAGNLAFLEFLDAQRTLFATRVSRLEARHDRARAAARIESLMEAP